MATFTWTSSYNPTATRKPRVKVAKFGDGYEQRLADGINTIAEVWQLTFAARTNAEAGQIDDFLKARAAVENFDWTPPNGLAGKYICREWSRTPTHGNAETITATFEQVFE